MLVPVPVNVVPIPKGYWCSAAFGYQYQKATGALLLLGIGTGLLGTGTNCVLHVGTGTIVCGTGTIASANAPPHRSTSRDFSTVAAINRNDLHSFSGH